MWNTKGFGPATAGFLEYRVYVNLIYPGTELNPPEPPCTSLPCEDEFGNQSKVDGGQNNEGWSIISVQKSLPEAILGGNGPVYATSGSLEAASTARGAVPATGLAASDARSSKPKALTAFLYQPLHLKVSSFIKVSSFSGGTSSLHGQVSIYDGDPAQSTSKTIAIKTLRGVNKDGTSAWFDWTPRERGYHHLYAVIKNPTGTTTLGDLLVKVNRPAGDLNGDGRVDRHDLNILNRDLGKDVSESACGEECDLDGSHTITEDDIRLTSLLCDSKNCAFSQIEYVGGPSALEPDMQSIHSAEAAADDQYLAAHSTDKDSLKDAGAPMSRLQMFKSQFEQKKAARKTQFYYKGAPVTNGPFAPDSQF